MAAFKHSAPPLFLTEITENKNLLLEKTLPACCPHLKTPALKDSQPQTPGTGQPRRGATCLPVELLFVLHPHVLREGIVIFVGVPVDNHIFADDAGASAAATWIFHGCVSDLVCN